jgi:hypothetical protein
MNTHDAVPRDFQIPKFPNYQITNSLNYLSNFRVNVPRFTMPTVLGF